MIRIGESGDPAGRFPWTGVIVLAVLATTFACGSGGSTTADPDTWEGTITTEDDVRTVVNESGSVWAGEGVLVEEASIGVAEGADEEMLGMPSSVHATDERIYVLDSQAPQVRVYDHDGHHVQDLGRRGEGPGEYARPAIVTAREDGRVFVYDSGLRRINVYAPSGEALQAWPLQDGRCCVWPMYSLDEGAVWAPIQSWLDRGASDPAAERRYGARAVGPEGPFGDIVWVPEIPVEQTTHRIREGLEHPTPHSPWLIWNPTPDGGIVAGASDRYRFEIHRADGGTSIVEKSWEPVPLPPEHREWERQRTVARNRSVIPDWDWDGAEMPTRKSAYKGLIPSMSGETWVIRMGPSRRVVPCAEDPIENGFQAAFSDPCWIDELSADVFGADGRFLGPVSLPEDLWGNGPWGGSTATMFHVDGNRVVAVVQDARGTFMVKRYRLELPSD